MNEGRINSWMLRQTLLFPFPTAIGKMGTNGLVMKGNERKTSAAFPNFLTTMVSYLIRQLQLFTTAPHFQQMSMALRPQAHVCQALA